MPLANSVRYLQNTGGAGGMVRDFYTASTLTLAARVAAIGSNDAVLEISGAEAISSSLDIPSNIVVVMLPGSLLTVSGTDTELYIANCVIFGCSGPYFSIGADSWVILGAGFDAPLVHVFGGNGYKNVRFGLSAQIITNRFFPNSTGWTLGTGWSVDVDNDLLTATAAEAGQRAVHTIPSITGYENFWTLVRVSSITSGSFAIRAGNSAGQTIDSGDGAGLYEDVRSGANTNTFYVSPITTLTATISMVSCRYFIGGIDELNVEWWGAAADGRTDCYQIIQDVLEIAGQNYDSAMPRIAKLNGIYLCSDSVELVPDGFLHGIPSGAGLLCRDDFAGTFLLGLDGTYGGYQGVGDRQNYEFIKNVSLGAGGFDGALQLLRITETCSAGVIRRTRCAGNGAGDQQGMYIDASASSATSLRITESNITDCNPVSTGRAAMEVVQAGNAQNMQIDHCDFNGGKLLWLGGSNNTIGPNNNFQGGQVGLVKARGQAGFITTSGTISLAAEAVITVTASPSSGTPVIISGVTQSGWTGINGLWVATRINSTTFSIEFNSSALDPFTDTATIEQTGGTMFPVVTYNRNHKFINNYFDGMNVIRFLALENTSVGGTTPCIDQYGNTLSVYESAEMVVDSGTFAPKTYAFTAGVTRDKFVVTGNQTGVFIAGDLVWVYQSDIGYVQSTISSSTYGTATTVTIADLIIMGTGDAIPVPSNYRTNQNIHMRGQTYASSRTIYESVDPTAGNGIPAPIGTTLIREDTGAMYVKTSSSRSGWSLVTVS